MKRLETMEPLQKRQAVRHWKAMQTFLKPTMDMHNQTRVKHLVMSYGDAATSHNYDYTGIRLEYAAAMTVTDLPTP